MIIPGIPREKRYFETTAVRGFFLINHTFIAICGLSVIALACMWTEWWGDYAIFFTGFLTTQIRCFCLLYGVALFLTSFTSTVMGKGEERFVFASGIVTMGCILFLNIYMSVDFRYHALNTDEMVDNVLRPKKIRRLFNEFEEKALLAGNVSTAYMIAIVLFI